MMTDRSRYFAKFETLGESFYNRILNDFYGQPGLLLPGFKENNLGRLCPWICSEEMSNEVSC